MKRLSSLTIVIGIAVVLTVGCAHKPAATNLVILDNFGPSLYVKGPGDIIYWTRSTPFTINFTNYSPCNEGLKLAPGAGEVYTAKCTIKTPIEDGDFFAYTIQSSGDTQTKNNLTAAQLASNYVQSGGCNGCPMKGQGNAGSKTPSAPAVLVNVSCAGGTGAVTVDNTNPTVSQQQQLQWIPLGPRNITYGAVLQQSGSTSPCDEGFGSQQSPLHTCTISTGTNPAPFNYTIVRSDCNPSTNPETFTVGP